MTSSRFSGDRFSSGGIIGERQVRSLPLLEAVQELEHLANLVALLQPSTPVADVCSIEGVGFQSCLANQIPQFRRPPVNELRAQLENLALVAQGEDPSAHTIARLQHQHLAASLRQQPGRRQPGHSRTDHQDALSSCFHIRLDAPAFPQHPKLLTPPPDVI